MSDINPISLLNASVQPACYLVPDKPRGNADAFFLPNSVFPAVHLICISDVFVAFLWLHERVLSVLKIDLILYEKKKRSWEEILIAITMEKYFLVSI